MPRPLRKEFAGAKYHVTSRGNGRKAIFLDAADYRRFMSQLQEALQRDGVILYAYVLMPNHYHLLVETPRANLQAFMRRLNTAYALFFRYKHRWPGHVFQGRYGAKRVEVDEYLLRVTRYIHLNPVRVRSMKGKDADMIKKVLRGYEWSSGRGYAGWKKPEGWVDYRCLKLMQGKSEATDRQRYRGYLESMALERDEEMDAAMKASRHAIGDEGYRKEIEASIRGPRQDQVPPSSRQKVLSRLESAILREFGGKREDLRAHGNHGGVAKSVALELACRKMGYSQVEAGCLYGGITCAAVGQQRRRLMQRMPQDTALLERVKRIEQIFNV